MIHIACTADELYAPHCAAMLHSLLTHNDPAGVRIHYLHGPLLPEHVFERLRRMVGDMGSHIEFHEMVGADVDDLPVMRRIPKLMWYRVLLPERLQDLSRIIYLDADTVVLGDLGPLWSTDLSGCYLGAVNNVFEPEQTHRAQAIGLSSAADYFNSGVMLMNLDAMRQDGCSSLIQNYARSLGEQLLWPDQDALNAVLWKKRYKLHPRWNCQNSLFYFVSRSSAVFGVDAARDAARQPMIVHFEGPDLVKPWHYLSKHPYRHQYYLHLASTPWPVTPPLGLNWTNRLLRILPMRLLPLGLRIVRRLKCAKT